MKGYCKNWFSQSSIFSVSFHILLEEFANLVLYLTIRAISKYKYDKLFGKLIRKIFDNIASGSKVIVKWNFKNFLANNIKPTLYYFSIFPQLKYRKSCSKNAFFYCNSSFQYQPSPYLWPSVYWLFHALDCYCIAALPDWKIFFQYYKNWEQLFSINQFFIWWLFWQNQF